MCGISGIYNTKNDSVIDINIVRKMLQKIAHRGPDGEDVRELKGTVLGFNRLSFLDLTGGMQPIFNETETVFAVTNGEIYNFRELKKELEEKGHVFRTKTDIETVIHLYEEYGDDFPNHLNGQFAIALYDSEKDRLFLVRDQFGVCPLFYTEFDGRVIFASEIKAILEYPGVPRRLNMKAVDQLMNFPGVVSPNTFFKDIYSLAPGHMKIIDRENGVRDIEYWDMLYPCEVEDKGEEYYAERLREILKNTISRRLIADVPIGFYISGGLDSSIVACYIGKFMLDSFYSFSAEIGEADLDESRFQKMVHECTRSEHFSVKVSEREIWDTLYDVIYHAESGVKESYDCAAYLLSNLVGQSPAKAVLTGQGSDELFSGYAGYMVDLFRNMRKTAYSAEEREMNERLWGDPEFRFERDHPTLRKTHMKVYGKNVRGSLSEFSALSESPVNTDHIKGLSDQRRRSYIDLKLRLGDHLLGEHGDRMFFSHSVEGRHPFLDMELVEFLKQVPDKYKLHGTNEKYILKKAGEGIVPEPILKRKKFPFQAPGMSSMIKDAKNIPWLERSMIEKYGVFDPDYVEEMKKVYLDPDFRLMGAYEIDYLLIVMTTTMLCEHYGLSL